MDDRLTTSLDKHQPNKTAFVNHGTLKRVQTSLNWRVGSSFNFDLLTHCILTQQLPHLLWAAEVLVVVNLEASFHFKINHLVGPMKKIPSQTSRGRVWALTCDVDGVDERWRHAVPHVHQAGHVHHHVGAATHLQHAVVVSDVALDDLHLRPLCRGQQRVSREKLVHSNIHINIYSFVHMYLFHTYIYLKYIDIYVCTQHICIYTYVCVCVYILLVLSF